MDKEEKTYDLHIHTNHSICSNLRPKILLKVAKKRGLSGIAVTDHNTMKGAHEVSALNKDPDFEVIKGTEINTRFGHILVYYLQEELGTKDLLTAIDRAREQDAIISIAHPFQIIPTLGFSYDFRKIMGKFDALETFNARVGWNGHNTKALAKAKELMVAQTGGSDSHFPYEVGRGRTIFTGDLRDAIKNKTTRTEGSNMLAGFGGMLSVIEKRFLFWKI